MVDGSRFAVTGDVRVMLVAEDDFVESIRSCGFRKGFVTLGPPPVRY